MKKIHQVHMLPTDKGHGIPLDRMIQLYKEIGSSEIRDTTPNKLSHIYFTSDEEIKEGDWYLHYNHKTGDKTYHRADSKFDEGNNPNVIDRRSHIAKYENLKIIATTNPELWGDCMFPKCGGYQNHGTGHCGDCDIKIAKIPLSFIKEYVEKPVKEVNLEYEYYYKLVSLGSDSTGKNLYDTAEKLVLDSNGCVIVSPIEEKMYTREQAMRISYESMLYGAITCEDISNTSAFEKWFDKNYPK